jgi:hypothetical protein
MLKRTKEVLGWIKKAELEVVESKGTPGNCMEVQVRAKNGSTKWFRFTTIGEHPHAEQRAVERFARDNAPQQTQMAEALTNAAARVTHRNKPTPISPAFARAEISAALTLQHAAALPTKEIEMNQPPAAKPAAQVHSIGMGGTSQPPAPPAPLKTEGKADKPGKPPGIVKISQVQFFKLATWCKENVLPGSDETYNQIAARAVAALGFELSPSSIPTALEAVGIKLAEARHRMGTFKRSKVELHQRTLAKRLLEVYDKLGMIQPGDLVQMARDEDNDERYG